MKTALKKITTVLPVFAISIFICLTLFFQIDRVSAEQTQSQQSEINPNYTPQENEYISTLNAAINSATQGPAAIPLLDQGMLDIPENYLFVPAKEAAAFMKANGNITGPEFVGFLVSKEDNIRWLITINFIKSGYVRDDDAKNWSADDLMKNIKEGNDIANEDRIKNGFSPFDIIGWIESPKYNNISHQLIWSILGKSQDSTDSTVNYNTYVLGREGYFKLDLITSNSSISVDKQHVNKMLASLHYNQGKRYEDFAEGKDQVAKYGLAALITGVVAKKLGLLALTGVFLVKIWKLLLLIPLILSNKIKTIFKKKKS
jgi:uncharacterized membrane-anchored protein